MKNQVVKFDAPELSVIEESKAEQIKKTFEPMAQMIADFEGKYNEIITESEQEITRDLTAKAKRVRLDIGRVRIETEKLRKREKEEYLRAGKAIDGVSNILKWAISDKEIKLKEIEDHFEILEQKRLEALQAERVEQLSSYVEDAHERNLSDMEDDVWQAYLSAKKKEHEDRIEAEKKVEAERIAKEKAEAEERERIRKENEQLRKEAEERERQAKIEAEKRLAEEKARREKEEAERKAREEKERKEREERDAKERKEREAYEAKLKAEREQREKVQRELEAKAEAERKAKEEEEARIQNELSKGDADKVQDLINDLEALKSKYVFKSAKNKKMYEDVGVLIGKVVNFIKK